MLESKLVSPPGLYIIHLPRLIIQYHSALLRCYGPFRPLAVVESMLHNSTGALQPLSGQEQPRDFIVQAKYGPASLLRARFSARTSCRACSQPCSSSSSSSNHTTPLPGVPGHSSSYQRRCLVATQAWFGQQASQQRLWGECLGLGLPCVSGHLPQLWLSCGCTTALTHVAIAI